MKRVSTIHYKSMSSIHVYPAYFQKTSQLSQRTSYVTPEKRTKPRNYSPGRKARHPVGDTSEAKQLLVRLT